jgi:multidrug resistance efflux pump
MLEMMLCSLFTLVPDYLYRRYGQGKRFRPRDQHLHGVVRAALGHHRLPDPHGTADHHGLLQSSKHHQRDAAVPHDPDPAGGKRPRRRGLHRSQGPPLPRGAPIFRLDSTKQEAAVETAKRKMAEVDAAFVVAKADIVKAEGQLRQAKGGLQQAQDELETKLELQRRNSGIVPQRDIDKLRVAVDANEGAVAAADAARQAAEIRVGQVLPAEKASAEAELAAAQVDLDKTVIRAGVDGRVEQFFLRVGDVVNPMIRSAGVLIPEGAGQRALQAGFSQIEAQIMKVGMIAEVTCASKPFTIIPMVVTEVQDFVAAGQFRGGEQLIDPTQVSKSGTLLVFLEPLYKGGLDGVTPGSSCIANAYSNNHDAINAPGTGAMKGFALHAWTRSRWCTR